MTDYIPNDQTIETPAELLEEYWLFEGAESLPEVKHVDYAALRAQIYKTLSALQDIGAEWDDSFSCMCEFPKYFDNSFFNEIIRPWGKKTKNILQHAREELIESFVSAINADSTREENIVLLKNIQAQVHQLNGMLQPIREKTRGLYHVVERFHDFTI